MEITKHNEIFNLKETTDVYNTSGSINRETSGTLNINININNLSGDHVGNCNYSKFSETNDIHFSVNCVDENREELSIYANSIIDSALEYFKSNN